MLDDERRDGQTFLFDVELEVGEEAAASDRIEDAVDYRDVVACVREVSDARAYHLLEALAAGVADELLSRFPVERVRVRVRKPDVEPARARSSTRPLSSSARAELQRVPRGERRELGRDDVEVA